MAFGGCTGRQPAHLRLYKQERGRGLTRAARSCNESRKSTQTRFPSKIEAPWRGFQTWRGALGEGSPQVCPLPSICWERPRDQNKKGPSSRFREPARGSCKGRVLPHSRSGGSWLTRACTKSRPVLQASRISETTDSVHMVPLGFTSKHGASPGTARLTLASVTPCKMYFPGQGSVKKRLPQA